MKLNIFDVWLQKVYGIKTIYGKTKPNNNKTPQKKLSTVARMFESQEPAELQQPKPSKVMGMR